MNPITPLILYDAHGVPVAVQIKYEEWVLIQEALGLDAPVPRRSANDFRGTLKLPGHALEYQREARAEWDRRVEGGLNQQPKK